MEERVCPPYNKVFVYVQRAPFTNVGCTGNFKNSHKQRIWPHYLLIHNEIRKNSYKRNQAQRNLIHDVASIVSMLFYFVFGQALSPQCEKGGRGGGGKRFLTEVQ